MKIAALEAPEATTLMQVESAVAYAAGHLLFNRAGTLMAQAFDATTRSLQGEPFAVIDDLSAEGSRYASFSLSDSGTLVYARGRTRSAAQLTWLDRSGRPSRTVGDAADYVSIALSPDDRTIAATFVARSDSPSNIQVIDAATGDRKRATFERAQDYSPVWAPDSQRVAFVARRDGVPTVSLLKIASLQEEVLLRLPALQSATAFRPSDWSRDGRYIVGTVAQGTTQSLDIWTVSLDSRETRPLVETTAQESNAVFSPDGKWVAYEVTDLGREGTQVFVRRFPPTDERHQVSATGGIQPVWGPGGNELFFLTPTGEMTLMRVEITPGQAFHAGAPRPMFPVRTMASGGLARLYAVGRDGERFLVAVRQPIAPVPLNVVVNWATSVK